MPNRRQPADAAQVSSTVHFFALAEPRQRQEENGVNWITYRLLSPLPHKFERLGESWELRIDRGDPEVYGLDAWRGNSCAPFVAVRYATLDRLERTLYQDGVEVSPRSPFAWMLDRLAREGKAERLVATAHPTGLGGPDV